MLAVDTAKQWGLSPMQILIPEHERDKYRDLDPDAIANADLALMKASVILKRESCQRCGTPYWLGYNTDRYIQFDIEEQTCYACAEMDRHNNKKKENDMAVNAYPVLNMMFDAERPSRQSWIDTLVSDD